MELRAAFCESQELGLKRVWSNLGLMATMVLLCVSPAKSGCVVHSCLAIRRTTAELLKELS